MSRLFGPLSETISSVSLRACAFAGENTAGAATPVPVATAVAEADFMNSRRFIGDVPVVAVAQCHSSRVPIAYSF